MKVLLDIPDKKTDSFMDVLRHISYVKAIPLTESKAELLSEIREAVHEVKQIKAGKKAVGACGTSSVKINQKP